MTLLVAGTNGSVAWMIADTAISNPLAPVHSRINRPKILPAQNKSLIGYADDADAGELAIFQASMLEPGEPVIEALAAVQRTHGSVEFAYAYMVDDHPKLVKIADDRIFRVDALFLGDPQAFHDFQAIRHRVEVDPPPDAIGTVHVYRPHLPETPAEVGLPDSLTTIIWAMTLLFARNSDRHVGGFVVPFILSRYAAQLLCYRLSITDAISRTLLPGSLIPRGTAAGGGYDFEMREIREANSFYIFSPQLPGGTLYVRKHDGYKEYRYKGNWPEFHTWLNAETGNEVGNGWFGSSTPQKKTALWGLFDTKGALVQGFASSASDFSSSHLYTGTEPYRTMPDRLPLTDPTVPPLPPDGLRGTVDEAGERLNIRMDDGGKGFVELNLTAENVDKLIRHLSALRAQLTDSVPYEPHGGVHHFLIDPGWRTYPNVHPEFPGVGFGLRHPGLGWQMYLFPIQEAEALSKSLSTLARAEKRRIATAVGIGYSTDNDTPKKRNQDGPRKGGKSRKKRR